MFPTHTHNYATQLLTYVEAHLSEPITLADLASKLALTPATYHQRFTRQTGQAPMRMVRETRLERAQELLRTTEATVTQIGESVGYRWKTHFCKAFRQHYGLTPETYRLLHQTQQSFDTLPIVCALWPRVGPETQAAILALLKAKVRGGAEAHAAVLALLHAAVEE